MNTTRIAGSLLSWAARQHRGRTALIFRDAQRSYDEVEAHSNRLSHALAALGLQPGERIGVLLNNSFASIDSAFAVEKAAMVYVPLNARHTLAEHVAILNDAEASAVLVGPEFATVGAGLSGQVASLRQVIAHGWVAPGVQDVQALMARMPTHAPAVTVAPDDLIRIAYTSGTTGRPKGVAYTVQRWNQRLGGQFQAMEYALGVDDAMLHVGPLTHAAGVHLLPCYLRGARNVIEDRFDVQRVLQQIERHRITQIMCVPTMLARLVDALEAGAAGDLTSLKRIHYGTAPTPPDLIRRAIAAFGPILRQQYGMTEAMQPLCVLYPHEHLSADDAVLQSCGKPTANVTITVRNPAGQEMADGEIGEIAMAHQGIGEVMFWRRPELMAQAVRDGWFYTGDLGRFDAEGFLHIVGRNKEMIISGGFNVYAREVEDALASHPSVAEVAVIGLPDREWGERVAAFVVLRAGAQPDADQLLSRCEELIAGYKKPRIIEFVASLPRNDAGKVLKQQLGAAYLARRSQEAAP